MKQENYREELVIPQGVKATLEGHVLVVSGPKGEVRRELRDPRLVLTLESGKLILSVKLFTKKEKMMVGTFRSHILNMFKGVIDPYVYKLKICSGHFPMNITVAQGTFTVKNFIGEKVPRVLKLKFGVDVKVEGEVITITHVNKEVAGQTASAIELLCRRPGFDRRVFQQGIFITEKVGKPI